MSRSRLAIKRIAQKVFILKVSTLVLTGLSTLYIAGRLNLNPVQATVAPTLDIHTETKIVEVDHSFTTERAQTMAYIVEAFGDKADEAIWLSKCESGLRRDAVNDKNSNGSTDYGVFQINSIHTKRYGEAFKTDWKANVQVAKKIYDAQGFTPWVCAKSIGHANYLTK